MKLVADSTQKCFEKLTPLPDSHTSISTNDCNYIQFGGLNDFFEKNWDMFMHFPEPVTTGDRGGERCEKFSCHCSCRMLQN